MIEPAMIIIGVISAFQLLPQIGRIVDRKSSEDLSLVSQVMGLFFQCAWVAYAIHHGLVAMMVAGGVWIALLFVLVVSTLYYRDDRVAAREEAREEKRKERAALMNVFGGRGPLW